MDTTTDLILGLLLVAHLATLRLLWHCNGHLSQAPSSMGQYISALNMGLDEVVRVGSDLCDGVEMLSAGVVSEPAPQVPVGDSVGNTILSLILGKVMEANNGETQQSWAVHEDNAQTNPSITDE